MNVHAGILDGRPEWDRAKVLILALTPGIPIEWVYAGFGLEWRRRRQLRAMLANTPAGRWPELGLENAQSVVQGDGLAMIAAVCPGYAGPAPLWTKLELENDRRSNGQIAAELGVHREKVRRWRVNNVFDPVSMVRIRPNRGRTLC